MLRKSPKGFRLHIGLFGRRNVGKSSLLNAITRQRVSIVSEFAGTTTDPVEKPMELLPLGPVLFIDTAGIDDEGALGSLRVNKSRQVIDRTEVGVIVAVGDEWGAFEQELLRELKERKLPRIVVFNKIDQCQPPDAFRAELEADGCRIVLTAADRGERILDFRQALLDTAPEEFLNHMPILRDIVGPGGLAILVIPIDKEAPKGRVILPQVQAIRDILDGDAMCLVLQDTRLKESFDLLKDRPRLVVTDSQAFDRVAADTPPDVPLTSFSILFSRFKGDLLTQTLGTYAIDDLQPGDRVLVAEACSHHPIEDDIGREKIPRWLQNVVGGPLQFDTVQGHDFPTDLSPYKLVIHCGACMWNRREVLSRIEHCRNAGVPMTNYGLCIAHSFGMLDRVIAPFPEIVEAVRNRKSQTETSSTEP